MQKDMMCKIIQNIMLNKKCKINLLLIKLYFVITQCYLYYI